MRQQKDTKRMALLGMLIAVLLVMGMTGIGFIPLPVIKATTMHIPVILGAILLGPGAGAVLGAVFGLCSIWAHTVTPGLLSLAFSPLPFASVSSSAKTSRRSEETPETPSRPHFLFM